MKYKMIKKIKFIVIFIFILIISILFAAEKEQFFGEDIYIVIDDKVNVHEKPEISSKIMMQLKIAEIVRLINRSGLRFESDSLKGEWVYVDTLYTKNYKTGETLRGWIVDYYLARVEQFREVKEFYNCKLEGYVEDSYIYYEFRNDGTYKHQYYDYDINYKIKKMKTFVGKLYKYKDVIITKDVGVQIFFIRNNRLCCADSELCVELK